jgi:uncharacterized protein (DUF427 family)
LPLAASNPAMKNSGPGYKENPAHRVATAPARAHVKVVFGGEVVADTKNAIRLEEGNAPPVFYVPRGDVKLDHFTKTQSHTYCPFKGEASYFTLSGGGKTAENAVWSYETPYDEVAVIKDHVAFYPNRVEISVE